MAGDKEEAAIPEARSYQDAYNRYYQQYVAQAWRYLMSNPATRKMHEKREEAAARWSCQACHVKNAAVYVGLVELLFVGAVLAVFIQYYLGVPEQTEFLIVGFVIGLLCGVTAVFVIMSMLVGVCRDMSTLVIPHLIAQCVGICLMTAIGALVLLVTFTKVEFDPSFGQAFPTILLIIGILCLAMALAEVWFFFLVRDCYQYLKRREAGRVSEEEAQKDPTPPPMQTWQPPPAPLAIEQAPPAPKKKDAKIVEIMNEVGSVAIAVKEEEPRKN